nr:MAG TPA: hypothetical protein [Caudoviricetes sp.]DAO48774.1 MAG TPA: hypothetical protein [Caudoviricetes sp.]
MIIVGSLIYDILKQSWRGGRIDPEALLEQIHL